MKTFAEMLKDKDRPFTQDMRDAVEAFHAAMEAWHECDDPRCEWPIEWMRSTPPAKEPVSVDGEANGEGDTFTTFYFPGEPPNVKPGDRVRVVRIEEQT